MNFQFIFAFTVFCLVNSLKPGDICYHGGISCENNINHTHTCGKVDCTVSRYECQEYILWTILFSRLNNRQQHQMHYVNFYSFHYKVNKCVQKAWSSEHVCLNSEKRCARRRIDEIGILSVKNLKSSLKMVKCACRGEYSYTCGRDFCSLNKIGCDGLLVNSTRKTNHFNKFKTF